MSAPAHAIRNTAGPLLLRAVAYVLFWVVLAGTGLKDLGAGVITGLIAAWISLQLLPPGELTLKPGKALMLFIRFLWQSVVAGVSVARIALSPVMALKPGMVRYPTGFPPGNRRLLFMTYVSLLPGTLPTGTDEDGAITVHCLDCGAPVAQQLAAEEERLAAVFGQGRAP